MLRLFGMGLKGILILGLWTALIVAVAVASCNPAAAPTPGLPGFMASSIVVPAPTPTPLAVEIPEAGVPARAGDSDVMAPDADPRAPIQPLAGQPDPIPPPDLIGCGSVAHSHVPTLAGGGDSESGTGVSDRANSNPRPGALSYRRANT